MEEGSSRDSGICKLTTEIAQYSRFGPTTEFRSSPQVIDDAKSVSMEYLQIGDYYQSNDELRSAQMCYVKAGDSKRAIAMYTSRGKLIFGTK